MNTQSATYLFLASLFLVACNRNSSHFINSFLPADIDQKRIVLDSLYQLGNPFILNGEATILVKSSSDSLYIAGDINKWQPYYNKFYRIESTAYSSYSLPIEKDAYLEYKIVDHQDWFVDPNNPKLSKGGSYINSILTGDEFVPPTEIGIQKVSHGTIDTLQVMSTKLKKDFKVIVYKPANYKAEKKFPYAIFHDGEDMLERAMLTNTLDNMIAHGDIKPMVGVFLVPEERAQEYVFEQRELFTEFIINELLPQLQRDYSLSENPKDIATVGASFGGYISVRLAYANPEIFGHCAALSCSYWPEKKELIGFVKDNMGKEVNYISVWGSYDGVRENNLEINRAFAQKGIPIYAREYPYGHNWPLWRDHMPEVLREMFSLEVPITN